MKAVLHFKTPDRVPNVEIGYWGETTARWQKEGLPPDMPLSPSEGDKRYSRHSRELNEYFQLDAHDIAYNVSISGQAHPAPTREVIAEDAETITYRFSDGYMTRNLKSNQGIFQELDWAVKTRKDWERVQKTFFPGRHEISHSLENLPASDRDFPCMLSAPGFFWQLRVWMGFAEACIVFHDDPGFARDMLNFWADYLLEQFRLVLPHFQPEYVQFDEDMCYNHGPMVSPATVREFILPAYRKVVSYINLMGIDVVGVDSDGLPDELIPILHEAGINLWSPFEIICRKGHADLVALGRKYPWLRMVGGIDKTMLSRGNAAIDQEVSKIILLRKRGGYLPCVDHKVPPEVSLDAYRYYLVQKTKLLR
jgi:uroporphyrinogen decarboxylase